MFFSEWLPWLVMGVGFGFALIVIVWSAMTDEGDGQMPML